MSLSPIKKVDQYILTLQKNETKNLNHRESSNRISKSGFLNLNIYLQAPFLSVLL